MPSFEALKSKWEEHQVQHPEIAHVMQPGLDKLADYQTHTGLVPAYVLVMGMLFIAIYISSLTLHFVAVNPSQKLDCFQDHMPEKYGDAKAIFVQAVGIS